MWSVLGVLFVIWSPSKQERKSPMLIQCRSTAYDAGPAHNQHEANASCLLYWAIVPIIITTKQKTSTQHRNNADTAPQTAGQHCTNSGRTFRACRDDHWPHTNIASMSYYNLPVQCWSTVYDSGPAPSQHGTESDIRWQKLKEETRNADRSLFRRWTKTGPTAKQTPANVSRSTGIIFK